MGAQAYARVIVAYLAVVGSQADCGTHGGGVVPVPGTGMSCTDCGPAPCIDVNDDCWSCSGSNGDCFPYYCPDPAGGPAMCSTQPCAGPPPPPTPPPTPDSPPSPPSTSGGASGEWTVNVWYKMLSTPDCTSAQPDATVAFTSSSCMCLIQEDGACLASATLKISKSDTVAADVYIGYGCSGDAIGGDTEVACGTCTAESILTGGVAFQIVCPFNAFGVCSQIGIPGGVDCYASCGVALMILVVAGCCCCRRRKQDHVASVAHIQAPRYYHAPNGSE